MINRPLLFCLAYILGLLSTGWLNFWSLLMVWLIGGIVVALVLPSRWRWGPRRQDWLIAAIIALAAVCYFQWRLPSPGEDDISQRLIPVPGKSTSEFIQVKGKIASEVRLTRSANLQFWLQATEVDKQTVTGKVYVTVAPDKAGKLSGDQEVTISGILYQPPKSPNPGGFDFSAYLARQGSFSALKAVKIEASGLVERPFWDVSWIADQIIATQVQGLGDRLGTLVASMVLGSRRVDLPYELRDQFLQAGLAHVLAASGFQVSFLLGVVLCLTRRLSLSLQFLIGLSTLFIYVGLTGVQPSVMRAAVMGFAVLIALVSQRSVKPFGSLVLAATILLLIKPLWIWDLGFQLSFLATLGLIVTIPALLKYLDWLPETVATMVAIPVAASVWTLPLLMYVFSNIATYSILSNIVAAPLVALISLGGMISACVAIVWRSGGSLIAALLTYPTDWLINVVEFFNSLPGSSLAVGKISLPVLLLVYGSFILICINPWCQRRWLLLGLFNVGLILLPLLSQKASLAEQVKVTVLAAKQEQVLVIQDRGKVAVINTGEGDTAKYILLPFLNHQGINTIDSLISLETDSNQQKLWVGSNSQTFAPRQLLATPFLSRLSPEKSIALPETQIKLVSAYPPILELQIPGETWLLLGDTKEVPELYQLIQSDFTPDVLMWSGRSLKKEWLELIKPKVAIALSSSVHAKTRERLEQQGIKLYWTGRDGALEWTKEKGLERFSDTTDIML